MTARLSSNMRGLARTSDWLSASSSSWDEAQEKGRTLKRPDLARRQTRKLREGVLASLLSPLPDRTDAWWRSYNDYLKSPEWQERRLAVRLRSGGICERCRLRRARQAHHLTYRRVGHENLTDLLDVCMTCHRELHEHKGRAWGTRDFWILLVALGAAALMVLLKAMG